SRCCHQLDDSTSLTDCSSQSKRGTANSRYASPSRYSERTPSAGSANRLMPHHTRLPPITPSHSQRLCTSASSHSENSVSTQIYSRASSIRPEPLLTSSGTR